jgi:hypothetical protein
MSTNIFRRHFKAFMPQAALPTEGNTVQWATAKKRDRPWLCLAGLLLEGKARRSRRNEAKTLEDHEDDQKRTHGNSCLPAMQGAG